TRSARRWSGSPPPPTPAPRSGATSTTTWTGTSRRHWTRSSRSTAPLWCSATSRASRTRRSARCWYLDGHGALPDPPRPRPAAHRSGAPVPAGDRGPVGRDSGGRRVSHLGPLVSSLVDGHLPPARAERAQAHLVHCAGCRAQVQAERALREAAARSAGQVRASDDLTQRLLALNLPGQSSGPLSTGYLPEPEGGPGRPSPRSTRIRVLSGAVASMGVFAVALFVLGGQQREVDDLTPLVALGGSAENEVASNAV